MKKAFPAILIGISGLEIISPQQLLPWDKVLQEQVIRPILASTTAIRKRSAFYGHLQTDHSWPGFRSRKKTTLQAPLAVGDLVQISAESLGLLQRKTAATVSPLHLLQGLKRITGDGPNSWSKLIKSSFLDSWSFLVFRSFLVSHIPQYHPIPYSWAMLGPKHELLAQGVDPERPWKTLVAGWNQKVLLQPHQSSESSVRVGVNFNDCY